MPTEAVACEVLMPRVSDTMTEGTVARWLKVEGDGVAKGEPIAEIDTDKVTMELEAPADGTLLRRLVSEGGTVAPGGVIALIGPEGAAVPLSEPEPPALPEPDVSEATPQEAGHVAVQTDASLAGNAGRPRRLRATPLARRLAAETGVQLQSLDGGSGPNGRILRQDVERALESRGRPQDGGDEVVIPGRLHMAIARRMSAAKQEIPHYYLDTTVDVTNLLALRSSARQQSSPLDVSLNAFVMRAAALALRDFPRVNGSWIDETIVRHASINIGLAVAVEDDGLFVPVIRNADVKSVAELAAASAELVDKARSGTLSLDDMGGGSFTISNLGMFGVDVFHAIINPPESGILAVGSVRPTPAFEGARITKREVLQISLSADHRVYSGATAASFLSTIRSFLEQPLRLL